jgi:hypothetical protein
VHWDACTVAALGIPYDHCKWREVRTLSGGEQKRLVLESLLRGPDEVVLLDEPDNYLDVRGKRCLTSQPTTSTCQARRPCKPGSTRSTVPCSPSPTTGGSRARSTGS